MTVLPNFRKTLSYIFMSLDIITEELLKVYNSARLVKPSNLLHELTVKDIVEEDVYASYGSDVPKTIPNSSTLWKSKFSELLSFSEIMGRVPDYFITLTQNDC